MAKKIFLTLSIISFFASCGRRSDNNANTFDEGVVINGVRWATRNVDAPGTFALYSESPGMLFQWNRKKAWNATDYEWPNRVPDWNNTPADPARGRWSRRNNPCPSGWRIPTRNELISLRDAGYSDFTKLNGISGYFFGTAPYQIFLPAVGFRGNNGSLLHVGVQGYYWGNPHYSTSTAPRLQLSADNVDMSLGWLAGGFSIRCVAK